MPKVSFNILDGLSFGERNAQAERLVNASFHTRIGALASRHEHRVLHSVTGTPKVILFHNAHEAIYTLNTEGLLFKNEVLVTPGLGTSGTLMEAKPNNNVNETWLFVASSNMVKYNGDGVYNWGIDPPPGDPLERRTRHR